MEEPTEPFTWAKLKEFCNGPLTEEQLSQTVRVIQEDCTIEIMDASELGEDQYLFADEEYSITQADFDPDFHCEGKYKSFQEALEKHDYDLAPKTNIYLHENFNHNQQPKP